MDDGDDRFLHAPETLQGTAAVLLEWLVAEGETVAAGDAIGQILESRGCVPVLAPEDGILEEHWVDEGASVQPGQRLARYGPRPGRSESGQSLEDAG